MPPSGHYFLESPLESLSGCTCPMSKHVHVWVIEQTTAPIAKGTCKVCKAEKTFNNSFEVALTKKPSWGWTIDPPTKAKSKDPDAIAEEFARNTYYVY